MKMLLAIRRIIKNYIVAGLIVLVPVIGTYLILKFIILSADNLVISLLPARAQPEELFGKDIPGLGLIVTLILIVLAGIVTRLYVGRKLLQLGDTVISKIPLGRTIYGSIKQFMGAVLTRDAEKFESVVVVEYPRRGCWMIGFVTGGAIPPIQRMGEKRWINLFIPTTPNPTSGFFIMVPEDDVRPLPISIEKAFKLIISGGIVQDASASL